MDVNDLKNIKASLEYIKKIIGAGTLGAMNPRVRREQMREGCFKTDMKNGGIIKEMILRLKDRE